MLAIFSVFAQEQTPGNIVGIWLSEDSNVKIEIYKAGPQYFGRQIWGQFLYEADGTTPKKDVNNSNESLRRRSLKNLIILNSGHNIAPEPIEEELFRAVPGTQHVMLVGNGRSFLAAIISGTAAGAEIDSQLERVNAPLPHYRKIRKYHAAQELFTIENGLLTANGKLRRDMIAARFATEIEQMYAKQG